MVADASEDGALPAELKAHRAAKGWTQAELGEEIRFSDSYISDVERGAKVASLPLCQALDAAFGTPGTFVRLRSVSLLSHFPEYFAEVVEYEQAAYQISGWGLGIPGLLQTEDYARALTQVTLHTASAGEVERVVRLRMQRQEMFANDRPPRVWYVLDEGALRRVVGGRAAMAAQLGRLLDVLSVPGCYVQVLPLATGGGIGVAGPVTVFEFRDRAPVAYTESNRGGRLTEDRTEVASRVDELNVIRVSALGPRPSADLIRKIREEMQDGQ